MKTQEKDSHPQAKEKGLKQILPSQPSEGTHPADTLILDFQAPELGDNKFLSLKPSRLWYLMIP